jgi:hypothetical protein
MFHSITTKVVISLSYKNELWIRHNWEITSDQEQKEQKYCRTTKREVTSIWGLGARSVLKIRTDCDEQIVWRLRTLKRNKTSTPGDYPILILITLAYITKYSMELSPASEAVSCASTQHFPNNVWIPEVYNPVQKIPSLVPILNQINSVYTIPSYLSKIHFNIIHPHTSWSS